MSKYTGLECPVCKNTFKEADDIVVCPECGAPYHRTCYQKEGHCIYEDKHGTDQAWQAKDRNMLAQIAHRILGASRYTGVPQLRLASQNLEDKCLLNVQHTTPAQFAMLKTYYEDLMLALNNLQNLDLSPYSQLNYHRLSEHDMNWKMI